MLQRLLIVGLGSIGRRHARLARALMPEAQIAALRHREVAVVEPGIDRSFTTLQEALDFRPQAAVIAGPATHHLEMATAFANARAHLLVEKPLADSSRGLGELIADCGARGLTLMTGYNLRFLPALRHFRELLHAGRIGAVWSVRAEVGQFLPAWRPQADYRQTVSAQAALGGGVLLEVSHEIDYLRWVFGEVDWVSAVLSRQSQLEIDVEDTAHLVLGFTEDARRRRLIAAVNMDFIRQDATRGCTAIGEAGSLRWNASSGTVEVFEKGSQQWQCEFSHRSERDESYLAEWQSFLESIGSGAPAPVSGEDGLAVLRIIEAARESSCSGATVKVSKEHAWKSSR